MADRKKQKRRCRSIIAADHRIARKWGFFVGAFGEKLIGAYNCQVWADSAYRSEDALRKLRKRGYKPRINHKGTRAKALSDRQDEVNRVYSKVRCRVEHVFGSMTNEMPQRYMRCIGKTRARTWIGLRNLCYNMRRLSYLQPSLSAV